MARGNSIIVSANPGSEQRRQEGFIAAGQTPKPGTIMQMDPTVALKSGRHTFKIFSRGADGKRPAGPWYVLVEDSYQGRTMYDAYAAGDRAFLYAPLPNDELNLLLGDVAGTGDDHAAGEVLMVDDTTGKMVATTGTPETEPAMLLESVVDPVADTLAWVIWSGQ